jgi:hypothetical protein
LFEAKKISSRWIPHELTEQNRRERFRICKHNLENFNSNKWKLCDVVTGDEYWFCQSWVDEGENPKIVVRRQQNDPKTMFCHSTLF